MSGTGTPISLNATTEAIGVQSLAPVRARDKDTIDQKREDARTAVAVLVSVAFLLVIAGSFVTFWLRGSTSADDVVKLVQAVLAPVVAIVGAVTGFYFSSATSPKPSP